MSEDKGLPFVIHKQEITNKGEIYLQGWYSLEDIISITERFEVIKKSAENLARSMQDG